MKELRSVLALIISIAVVLAILGAFPDMFRQLEGKMTRSEYCEERGMNFYRENNLLSATREYCINDTVQCRLFAFEDGYVCKEDGE